MIPGKRGTSDIWNAELARELDSVQRAGTAKGKEREVARVVSFLDRHKPDRRGELVACDREDGGGRVLDI